MAGEIRTGSAWHTVTEMKVRTGSAWQTVTAAWVRTGGAWQQFYDSVRVFVSPECAIISSNDEIISADIIVVEWYPNTALQSGDTFVVERRTTQNGTQTEDWTAKSGNLASSVTSFEDATGFDIESSGTSLVLEYRVQWYDSGSTLQDTSATATYNGFYI